MKISYEYLNDFLNELRRLGRYTFTSNQVKDRFDISDNAFKKTTQRLLRQNHIARLRQNFYLIIPQEYSSRGTLPLAYFVESLMNLLNSEYYVGLLTAAMYHAAAHHQLQQQFIIHDPPYLRPINKRRQSNFIIFEKSVK